MTALFNRVEAFMTVAPVIPVLTIVEIEAAVPLARALTRGGLKTLEITLRTDVALTAIERIAAEVPDALVGAGTVLDATQLEAAGKAGARFCVSPGSTPDLLHAARQEGMMLLPGAVTASEVMVLLEQEVTHLKFFPAESAGGVATLKSLAAPLPQARFCPTGGIHPGNAAQYLALPNVLCVGGTWVCPKEAVTARDWSRIETLARQAVQLTC